MYIVVARAVLNGEPTGECAELDETYESLGDAMNVANALSRTGVSWGYIKKPGTKLTFEV